MAFGYWLEAYDEFGNDLMSELVAREELAGRTALSTAVGAKVFPSGDVVPEAAASLRLYRNGVLIESRAIK